MKITKITIRNILGLDELEFEPGNVTIVRGPNAAGKTSVVRAIRTAVGGGHDATLIRNGAEEGETVLLFDDDTTVTKRITPKGSKVDVMPPPMDGGPQTQLNAWHDVFGLNPIDLIVDKKNRVNMILGAVDLTVTRDQVESALTVGDTMVIPKPRISDTNDALRTIDTIRKGVYEYRTDVNREAKKAKDQAAALRKSLPDDEGDDEQTLRDTIDDLQEQESELERMLKDVRSRIDTARERLGRITKDENTRRMIDEAEHEQTIREEESASLTTAIEQLDDLKARVSESLPFGINIDDSGDVLIGKIPWDNENTAKQIDIAMKLATMRTGEIPLVCVDGFERLDANNRRMFVEWAHKNAPDIQFIVTQVDATADGLTIEEATVNE